MSGYGAWQQGQEAAEMNRRATLGVNASTVNKAIKDIAESAEQITVLNMKLAQNSVIDILMKGWITESGAERIKIITDNFNKIATDIQKYAIELNEKIKETAEYVAWEGLRERVVIVLNTPSSETVQCDGAKTNDNGNAYIIVEFLKDARETLTHTIKPNVMKACEDMRNAASKAGLYDNHGGLQGQVDRIVNNMKTSIETNMDEMVNKITESIEYQSEEAERARNMGETILSAMSGNF